MSCAVLLQQNACKADPSISKRHVCFVELDWICELRQAILAAPEALCWLFMPKAISVCASLRCYKMFKSMFRMYIPVCMLHR